MEINRLERALALQQWHDRNGVELSRFGRDGKPVCRAKARRGIRWRVDGEGIHRRTLIELPPHEDTPPSPAVQERIDAIVTAAHRRDPMQPRYAERMR